MGYSAPAFGVLTTGFVPKLVGDVELDMTTQLRATVDPNLDLSPTEPMGQVMSSFASKVAEIWELAQTVYNMFDPNSAEGLMLDNICAITGTKRPGATYSRAVCTVNMNASTTMPFGTQAAVSGQPSNLWTLLGPADSHGNLLTEGDLVSTSSGNYSAIFQSATTGPHVANAGTLTVLPSSPTGINSITNPNDATVGTNADTDAQLRNLRNNELQADGACTLDAIRSAMLQIAGVQQCFVYENTTEFLDAFGRPAHTIEVVIFDGVTPNHALDNPIAQALWNNKPGGITFFSGTGDSGTAVDSQGNQQVVVFSRAQVVPIYLAYSFTPGPGWDPVNGPNAVRASAAAYGLAQINLSSTVYAQAFAAIIQPNVNPTYGVVGVPGDVTMTLGTSPGPTGTTDILMGERQIGYVQTTHVKVNGV